MVRYFVRVLSPLILDGVRGTGATAAALQPFGRVIGIDLSPLAPWWLATDAVWES
jgi:hypothetical protein